LKWILRQQINRGLLNPPRSRAGRIEAAWRLDTVRTGGVAKRTAIEHGGLVGARNVLVLLVGIDPSRVGRRVRIFALLGLGDVA